MANIQNHGSQREALSHKVIALPDMRRNRRMAAVTGAELNARLLILLGICITSAALVLSAVNILHG